MPSQAVPVAGLPAGKYPINSTPGEVRKDGSVHGAASYDYGVPQGTALSYAQGVQVLETGVDKAGTSYIKYKIDGDSKTIIDRHFSQINVKAGQHVDGGTTLGLTGGTPGTWGAGHSTGAHLHRETYDANGKPVDPNGQGSKTQGGSAGTQATITDPFDPMAAVPLVGGYISGKILEETQAKLVIPENLENPEWWTAGALVGNPHLKRIPTPVSFKICLNELNPSEYLPRRVGQDDPLELRLNCSLSEITQTMKHVVNKSNTRSGFHLTFWGMEPDTLTGSGSTGVFMNSFGITSLMSRNGDTDDLDNYVLSNYDGATLDEETMGGVTKASKMRYRIAAQDAFVELLSLFKNNGMVRFKTTNYTAAFDNRTQVDKSVWSTQYGASTFERRARNNDVMAKGMVYMTYKGNVYQGYFKNFNWTMDASSPHHWKFDFTFQVQRSINYVFYTR
jgi:hypothetical protein